MMRVRRSIGISRSRRRWRACKLRVMVGVCVSTKLIMSMDGWLEDCLDCLDSGYEDVRYRLMREQGILRFVLCWSLYLMVDTSG